DFHTGMSCRIGFPSDNLAHGYNKSVGSPIYSTGIGLLLLGHKELAGYPQAEPVSGKVGDDYPPSNAVPDNPELMSWLERFFSRLKLWFETEPDIDINVKKPVN
ncbi:MAG: hypothetical protein ACKOCO_04970, partial [Bacteroidota bacterium]